jgi:hypothetical protein
VVVLPWGSGGLPKQPFSKTEPTAAVVVVAKNLLREKLAIESPVSRSHWMDGLSEQFIRMGCF